MLLLLLGLVGAACADMMYHLPPGPHQLVLLSPAGDLSSVFLSPSCGEEEGEEEDARVIHPHEASPVDWTHGALHLVPIEAMDSIYVFRLNFSSSECWRARYSDTVQLAVVGSGDGLEVLGIPPPLPEQPIQDEASVSGQAAGAVLVWCALPLLLAAGMALTHQQSFPAQPVLLLQGFGTGGLLAVVVLYLYPQVVTRLASNDAPQWMGGSVILGGVCALALAELASVKLGGQFPVHGKLLGMFVGKLVEGVAISAAFWGCAGTSSDAGWFVLGALVAIALPQVARDLADLVAAKWTRAALALTAAHVPALVGMGIVLGVGPQLEGHEPALLLGFAIGVYLFVALSHVMPKLVLANAWDQWLFVGLGLASGAVAVGASPMGSGSETCW